MTQEAQLYVTFHSASSAHDLIELRQISEDALAAVALLERLEAAGWTVGLEDGADAWITNYIAYHDFESQRDAHDAAVSVGAEGCLLAWADDADEVFVGEGVDGG